ncbi:MAG TPA: PIN domain-containing protein [Allocoleopsis sp.]
MEISQAVGDTGFVVALANKSDQKHTEVTKIYQQVKQILLPQSVLAEVAYLIGREAGISTVITFLKGFKYSRFELVALTEDDLLKTAEILEQYKDSRIDFVDATVMVIAARFQIETILTLDQRDFRLFRPKHCNSFIILP